MKPQNSNVLVIGAAGGIGRHLSRILLDEGARLGLVALHPEELEKLGDFLPQARADDFFLHQADVTREEAREGCVQAMEENFGGVDILVNLAGINAFRPFEEQNPEQIERLMEINILSPMLMTRAVLPGMLERGRGQIVNIGSTFGSIGFPCFTSYCTSKFALRGFSQSLRRELAGTGVAVTYVAPRAVHTPINPPEVYEMADKINMHFDQPEKVADRIARAIASERKECYIGFPESFFARLNAILPGLVDLSLDRQSRIVHGYARQGNG